MSTNINIEKGIDRDINGKISAKRKWARVLIISGIIMAWLSFFIWAYATLKQYDKIVEIPKELIYVQLITGLGAIGFTIGERFTKKK